MNSLRINDIVRGIMRITSRIDSKWVKDYILRMREVNVLKLADLKDTKEEKSLLTKRVNEGDLEELKKEETAKRNDKIEEAKKRFLDRKKVKK